MQYRVDRLEFLMSELRKLGYGCGHVIPWFGLMGVCGSGSTSHTHNSIFLIVQEEGAVCHLQPHQTDCVFPC